MNFEIHCPHSLFFFSVSYRGVPRGTVPRGRASGFIGVQDWVKLAAASSAKSRRSYGKNGGCEQSKFENNLF